MKYHTLFYFPKLGKMSQNLKSAAVVIGALRVKPFSTINNNCRLLSLLNMSYGGLYLKQYGPRSDCSIPKRQTTFVGFFDKKYQKSYPLALQSDQDSWCLLL